MNAGVDIEDCVVSCLCLFWCCKCGLVLY